MPAASAVEQPVQIHVEVAGATSPNVWDQDAESEESIPEEIIEEQIEGGDQNESDDDGFTDIGAFVPLSDHCTMNQADLAAELADLAPPALRHVPPAPGPQPTSTAPTQVRNQYFCCTLIVVLPLLARSTVVQCCYHACGIYWPLLSVLLNNSAACQADLTLFHVQVSPEGSQGGRGEKDLFDILCAEVEDEEFDMGVPSLPGM